MIKFKQVFSPEGQSLGLARTWGEVAMLVADPRPDAPAALSREGTEGPEGFYLTRPRAKALPEEET